MASNNQNDYAASVAPSETSTLVNDKQEPDLQNFTAIGRAKPEYKPGISNMHVGGISGGGGVNHLPVKFTDDSIIRVPINIDKTYSSTKEGQDPESEQSHKRSFTDKLFGKKKDDTIRVVKMTRGDYLKYWAKDDHGNYTGTEPEEKGPELWRHILFNEDGSLKDDPTPTDPSEKNDKGTKFSLSAALSNPAAL